MKMDLEFLTGKLLNKEIKIETFNENGELGLLTNLLVNTIEVIKTAYYGYKIIINESINLYFDTAEPSDIEECKHCLCLFRSDIELVNIYLPDGESWGSRVENS